MHVRNNEPLQGKNTLALKASAFAYTGVAGNAELQDALSWAHERGKKVIPLGQGSNVVFAGDLNALLIRQVQRGIRVVEDNGRELVLKIEAGESWHSLVRWSLAQGYFGLENLALIPGTVGAAPIQNIGAYGVELSRFIRRVSAVQVAGGEPLVLSNTECEFAYRDSIFKRTLRDKLVITSLELVLSRQAQQQPLYPALRQFFESKAVANPEPLDIYRAVVDIRQSKLPDPRQVPNAGSFFKNPVISPEQADTLGVYHPGLPRHKQNDGLVKISAAWLIDQCGWKGKRVGNLGVHPRHALVLVNYGCDDGVKLLAFAEGIRTSVVEKFDIELEIEPRIYGLE